MGYEVHTEVVAARALAAAHAVTTRQRLGTCIIELLDQVWPLLREQGTRTGHNVVIYHGDGSGALSIDAGVEISTEFTATNTVQRIDSPAGEAAVAAHYGEYSEMAGAYHALERWCADNGQIPAGVSWEVYGDWDDSPARRRTDIYILLRGSAQL